MVSKSFPGHASYHVTWAINWDCLYLTREGSEGKKNCSKIS